MDSSHRFVSGAAVVILLAAVLRVGFVSNVSSIYSGNVKSSQIFLTDTKNIFLIIFLNIEPRVNV